MRETRRARVAHRLKDIFAGIILVAGLLVSSLRPGLFALEASRPLAPLRLSEAPAFPVPAAPVRVPGPLKAPSPLKAYFVNVGQGDSEYIELPNGKNVLIDAGPYPTSPLIQFLTERKVTKIDYMVLTHPHLDHYGGLDYVLSNIKIENFYDTRADNTSSTLIKKLRSKVKELGINTIYPAEGDELDWAPGVGTRVLHSCSEPVSSNSGPVLNDCSIVLKVTYQNVSIFYSGDMEADVEEILVSTYGEKLRSDVLKVGHHGSPTATSPLFVNTVKPKVAYIGVGAGNNFGFPAMITLSTLQAAGTAVYRTDLHGTLEYVIDGYGGTALQKP